MSGNTPLNSPSLITIVRAGAGAGKTRSLVHQVQNHFHHFIKEHERPPRMIVTTFTKKATQELRERLLLKAAHEKDWAFVEYLQSSDLFVTTIHGVLHQFLKKVSHLTGHDPSFQVLGEEETQRLARRILQKMVKEEIISSSWLSRYGFKRSQELAMEYVEQRAFRWLPLTLERYRQALVDQKNKILQAIQKELSALTLESENLIQYQQALLQCLKNWPESCETWRDYALSLPVKPRASKNTAVDSEKLESVQEHIKELKKFLTEEALLEDELNFLIQEIQEFAQWVKVFHDRFRQEKREASLMTMADLEALSVEILNDQPELCRYFASEWDYWLIDEFQDTSPVQMDVLEKLTAGKPCYLVGDPQQSIYLFRGAKSEIFHKEWDSADRHKVELNTNYRSRPDLIHLAADIFKSPMVPAREAAEKSSPIRVILAGDTPKAEILATVKGLCEKKNEGALWSKMAVLARTHQELSLLSMELRQRSIPFVLSGGQTFWVRREISDVAQFLKFLVNPHDNLNLVSLLRSPWLMIPHETLTKWIHDSKEFSYWLHFQKQDHPMIHLLKEYAERAQSENLISLAEEYAAEKGLLDSIIELDATGQKEGQVWKLLTWLRQQERLPGWQILKSLKQWDESLMGDPGSAREVEAVQLMTIHASKGLEFDHVFVLGTGKTPSVTKHKIFSADEEQNFWSFSIRDNAKNEFIATRFCRLHRENLRDKERAESKRLFYVAATRAKESLVLVASGDIKEDSWLSMLSLDSLEEGLVQRKGYQLQIERFDENAPLPELKKEKKGQPTQVRDLWKDDFVSVHNRAVAVTKMIENPFAVAVGEKAMEKKNRGVQVHKLFEVLKYHSWDGAEQWMNSQNFGGTSKTDFKKALNYIKNLKEIPFAEILERGQAEWPFQVMLNEKWIEGQIDLWAEVDGTIWLVDYKTGSKNNVDSAWKQLSWYGQALKELGYTAAQKHVVLYPLEETCVVREA